EAVIDQSFFVQAIQDRVVPKHRPAFIHHFGLALRIEILRKLPHDAHELALPWLELRRELFDEIEDVLLRVRWECTLPLRGRRRLVRQRAPEVTELPFLVRPPV